MWGRTPRTTRAGASQEVTKHLCVVYSFQDACISYMILVEKSVGFDTVFSCKCTEDEKGAYVIFDGIACGSKRLLVRNCRCDLCACCMAYRITERLNAATFSFRAMCMSRGLREPTRWGSLARGMRIGSTCHAALVLRSRTCSRLLLLLLSTRRCFPLWRRRSCWS